MVQDILGALVAQQSKALHLSARGVTRFQAASQLAVMGESYRAVHNWPSVVRVRVWPVRPSL